MSVSNLLFSIAVALLFVIWCLERINATLGEIRNAIRARSAL